MQAHSQWGAKWGAEMARQRDKLSALIIKNAAPGKLQDGGGLYLDRTSDAGKWIFRYSHDGNRREMGLGSYPDIPLAAARKARDRWAGVVQGGQDAISERNRLRDLERAEADRRDPTLEEIALATFEAKKAGLRGDGERGRWFSPLARHVIPKLGRKRISQIHQTDIRDCLAPIRKSKHPTAEKAIQRLAIVFRQARLSGYACDPFTVEAARHMLGEVRHRPVPIVATPWQEIPTLFARLDNPAASYQCLRMMILTCVRSDGVRGMLFSEIDGDVWTVPAERMKGTVDQAEPFRVPLSPPALEVLDVCREVADDDRVFASMRARKSLSDTAIHKTLAILGEAGQPHGFRTSFRTWVQDTDACGYDVAETVLAHQVGNKIERTYARSDLLDKRRVVMHRWAQHVTGAEAKVVKLRG